MKIQSAVTVLLITFFLVGRGVPVPAEKSAYVGEWQETTMYLLITQDGSIRYNRINGGVTTSVEGPLKGFDGDNFEAGIGPLSTKFVVSKPPFQEEGVWKMVVDGVELTKSAE